jgi:hypothetical protein
MILKRLDSAESSGKNDYRRVREIILCDKKVYNFVEKSLIN